MELKKLILNLDWLIAFQGFLIVQKLLCDWNEADEPTPLTKKGEGQPFLEYRYDDLGRRIEKKSNGQVTRYYYEGDSILLSYETDGTGSVLRGYVYSADGIRLAMKTQGTTLNYHYNPRGDVVAMTDDQNTIVAKYRYDEWSNVSYKEEVAIAADNPFGYAGYWYEEELGMYYFMVRYYHHQEVPKTLNILLKM